MCLKQMKQKLIEYVSQQIENNLHCVNAKQLGQAIDMIKDLDQAIYYHTITQSMRKEPGVIPDMELESISQELVKMIQSASPRQKDALKEKIGIWMKMIN